MCFQLWPTSTTTTTTMTTAETRLVCDSLLTLADAPKRHSGRGIKLSYAHTLWLVVVLCTFTCVRCGGKSSKLPPSYAGCLLFVYTYTRMRYDRACGDVCSNTLLNACLSAFMLHKPNMMFAHPETMCALLFDVYCMCVRSLGKSTNSYSTSA